VNTFGLALRESTSNTFGHRDKQLIYPKKDGQISSGTSHASTQDKLGLD
jgi:hypothetical protein